MCLFEGKQEEDRERREGFVGKGEEGEKEEDGGGRREGGGDCERKQGFSCGTDAARVAVGSTAVADKRCF